MGLTDIVAIKTPSQGLEDSVFFPTPAINTGEMREGLIIGLNADTSLLNSRAIPLGMSPKRTFAGSPEERPRKFQSTGASPQLRRRTATVPNITSGPKPPNWLEKLRSTGNKEKKVEAGAIGRGGKSNRGRKRSVTLPSNQPLITSRLTIKSTPTRGKNENVSMKSSNASNYGPNVPSQGT